MPDARWSMTKKSDRDHPQIPQSSIGHRPLGIADLGSSKTKQPWGSRSSPGVARHGRPHPPRANQGTGFALLNQRADNVGEPQTTAI